MRSLAILLPAALLGLAGCSNYAPPPRAVLNCENFRSQGDFEYLNCIRGETQVVDQPAAQAAPASQARPPQ
jgi:hypothetical protein